MPTETSTETITYNNFNSFSNSWTFTPPARPARIRKSEPRDCNCPDCQLKRDRKYKKAMKDHKSKNNNKIAIVI